ncbi:uncharacterized protein LOC143285108 [Babylonia areolata]|uniref:uncharacterized protein LOC143285108 n=1 Tax=Babylonia areolata TaxID=304850 RepID=UPI003FD1DD2D
MDTKLAASCFLLAVCAVWPTVAAGSVVKPAPVTCPTDYRRRVETCITEAALAPQAGGGISLVINKDKIVDLCDRGMLMKTIDCLKEIHSRCSHNDSVLHELDRLYSVSNWQQANRLLCQDTQLFQRNFECLSRSTNSVMTCYLMRTHTFRMQMAFTSPNDHAKLRKVTCDFAEGIVKCLRGPLWTQCSREMGQRVSETMFLLLPPFCLADSYITPSPYPPSSPTATATTTTTTQSDDTEKTP